MRKRQRIRRTILLVSMLFFPVTLNYLSPYLVISGSWEGVLSGSGLLFAAQFASAVLFGRAWCGWACPAGAVADAAAPMQTKAPRRWLNGLKYAIWVPWLAAIVAGFVASGGLSQVNVIYLTDGGISVHAPAGYIIYFAVVGLIVVLSLTLGKRAFCHSLCWMAPFLVIGNWLRETLRLPGLRLTTRPDRCIGCGACTRACPMSLSVQAMAQAGNMRNSECILCGGCADACPKDVLCLGFQAAQKQDDIPAA